VGASDGSMVFLGGVGGQRWLGDTWVLAREVVVG